MPVHKFFFFLECSFLLFKSFKLRAKYNYFNHKMARGKHRNLQKTQKGMMSGDPQDLADS